MIRSMTGFGRAEIERDGLSLTSEIRTVNHKFCEVSVRLPRSLSLLENQVRIKVQEALTRGKVNLTINWKDGREQEGELALDEGVAEQYARALGRLRERFELKDPIDLKTLVGLPDISPLAGADPGRGDRLVAGRRAARPLPGRPPPDAGAGRQGAADRPDRPDRQHPRTPGHHRRAGAAPRHRGQREAPEPHHPTSSR